MSATPPVVTRRAPMLGEHTDEVLSEAGLSGDEIAGLRESGAIQ
jgi:crotonobetainyl-CoA:carnitine CoA-transferase CaiB-like acyl-CoA transferase